MAESVLSEDDEVKSTKRPLPYQKTKLSKKARQEEKEDKLLDKAIACMEKTAIPIQDSDEYNIFGKHVAHELRSISNAKIQR